MKVIIAGSRSLKFDPLNDLLGSSPVFSRLWNHFDNVYVGVEEIVSGGAAGVDQLGEFFAEHAGYKLTVMKADWEKHGKAAGAIRNEEMAKYADALYAIWDGKSRGTKHMIDTMLKERKPVYVTFETPIS